ncbi:MAG: LegC family aminotransferase, partial [bacterium]
MNYKFVVDFIKSLNMNKEFIPLHEPKFIGKEKEYVMDTIESTYVSSVGKYGEKFEKDICEYTGAKFAVACVNGTAALHLAMRVAGVESGDIVLTQPLSFIATCNAITYTGAEPLFLDIDKETLGLSTNKLQSFLSEKCEIIKDKCYHKKTGKKIQACIPMHTFGHSSDIVKTVQICSEYNIAVIEDAAESMGSFYNAQHTGTFGLLGAFSFNGNKIITCGGGGMIVTDDEELAKHAKHLSTQSKIVHKWEFAHDNIGYNYRLPNINAALGVAQLEMLDTFVDNKRELAGIYKDFFEDTEIDFFSEPVNCKS